MPASKLRLSRPLSPWIAGAAAAVATLAAAPGEEASVQASILVNFNEGWEMTDPAAWQITEQEEGNRVLELAKKKSDYRPPHRSPLHIAWLEGAVFGDFELTARVQTTHESYGHRDLCFFFGRQDPAHFYYVHLGQKTDDHANQIFIVNGADRTKISEHTTEGTPWQDGVWHRVKIVRKTSDGTIRVYFDDMENPVMEAHDHTFSSGWIGVGSFDDTGMWDDIRITGRLLLTASKD